MKAKHLAVVSLVALLISVALNFVLLSKLKKNVLPVINPISEVEQIDQKNQDLEVTIQELQRNDSAFLQAAIEWRLSIKEAENAHKKKTDRIRVLDADSTVQLLSTNLSKVGSTGK